MLLNKSLNQGDVVTFKFVSGEEVIARYQSETLTDYQVTKPITLTPTPNGSIGMIPTVFSGDTSGNLSFNKSAITVVVISKKEFADEYTKATSSIKPASSLDGIVPTPANG